MCHTISSIIENIEQNTNFGRMCKIVQTKKEADDFIDKIQKQQKMEQEECVKQFGLLVPITWLQNKVSKNCFTFFRLAQSLNFVPDSMNEIKLELDPYFLGLWLGDGTSATAAITTMDKEIVDYMNSMALTFDGNWSWKPTKTNGKATTYVLRDDRFSKKGKPHFKNAEYQKAFIEIMHRTPHLSPEAISKILPVSVCSIRKWKKTFVNIGNDFLLLTNNPICGILKTLKLRNNKHIPKIYFQANRESKLQLLAGLLDTDGFLKSNSYEIIQKNIQLAKDIHRLANELGFFVYRRTKLATCSNGVTPESKTGIPVERMSISGLNLNDIPCLLPRKQWKPKVKDIHVLPRIQFGHNEPIEPKPKKRKLNWTLEQDVALMDAIKVLGQKWSKIRDSNKLFSEYSSSNIADRYKYLKSKEENNLNSMTQAI
jgi:hypothetical protein